MRPLHNQEVQENVIKRLANGETQTAVAHSLGVSQAAISKFASNPEVRELIRAEALKLVGNLPTATDNIRHLIENMQGSNDPKMKELGYKASLKVLETAGIIPGQSSSYVFNTFIDNRQELSPIVRELLARHMQFPDDPIEAEFEKVGTEELEEDEE